MAGRNIFADILGGQFILNKKLNKHWPYFLFIFALAVGVISYRLWARNMLIRQERNAKIIKELKAEDSSKKILLLEMSKQEEVRDLLKKNGINIDKPTDPPVYVKRANSYE